MSLPTLFRSGILGCMTMHRNPPRRLRPEVEQYANALLATGMEEREVARAAFFVQQYGLASLTGPGCVSFDEPSCANWNCLRPDHQRVSK